MVLKRCNTVLSVLVVLAGLGFGLNFLLNGEGAAAGFGIDPWPEGDAAGYLIVKGVRDIAYGLTALVLLVLGQRRALGWVVLAHVIIPVGDCLAVLSHGGSVPQALAMHGAAAVLVTVVGLLLLREKENTAGREPVAVPV
jgi:hypothetical protein